VECELGVGRADRIKRTQLFLGGPVAVLGKIEGAPVLHRPPRLAHGKANLVVGSGQRFHGAGNVGRRLGSDLRQQFLDCPLGRVRRRQLLGGILGDISLEDVGRLDRRFGLLRGKARFRRGLGPGSRVAAEVELELAFRRDQALDAILADLGAAGFVVTDEDDRLGRRLQHRRRLAAIPATARGERQQHDRHSRRKLPSHARLL